MSSKSPAVRQHHACDRESKVHAGYVQHEPGLFVSYAFTKGDQRACMEDRTWSGKIGPETYLYMLLDGHNGIEAVDHVTEHFPSMLMHYLKEYSKSERSGRHTSPRTRSRYVRKALEHSFQHIHDTIREDEAGTTMSLILSHHNELWSANVGDSPIYQVSERCIRPLFENHNITANPGERARLEKTGDYSFDHEHYTFFKGSDAGLAMSRAIGDKSMGPGILQKPYLTRIRTPFLFIAMGSDGFFDVVNDPTPLRLWAYQPSMELSAAHVLQLRNNQHEQHDNISIMLLFQSDSWKTKQAKEQSGDISTVLKSLSLP